jgi:hypothetical protein
VSTEAGSRRDRSPKPAHACATAPAAPGLAVNFQEVSGVRLAPEVERARIGTVREALHDVRKHAHAESVRWLEVRRVAEAVEIAVVDDGGGFDGLPPTGQFGLEQIRELAEETAAGSRPGRHPDTRYGHHGQGVDAALLAAVPAATSLSILAIGNRQPMTRR